MNSDEKLLNVELIASDASGDSTYEAWDKTLKSETVELNLQHGCKTDEDK